VNFSDKKIAIIGGGPAGLIAAEKLSAQGLQVTVYERKPSVGRKFLMAGRGGLNLTHSEDLKSFIGRYGPQAEILRPIIRAFPPQALRDWCEGLGEKTFIGTSGRVFPESLKASPLLRAWLARLEKLGVRFMLNHDWRGWDGSSLIFETPDGPALIQADAVLLALGGASWPRLGPDGSWVEILKQQDVRIAPLQPANCGFVVEWSDVFRKKFAGQPLKPVITTFKDTKIPGEIMITEKGVEGGAIYALSSLLREEINQKSTATLILDLKPDLSVALIEQRLKKSRGRDTFSNHLRKTLRLPPVAIGLIMEKRNPPELAPLIKNYSLTLQAPFSIERAISSAGGISFDSVDTRFMLENKPGVFVAGEMLDWEAPTGGYLLQACFATGIHAAQGIIEWLQQDARENHLRG
jgi:uncharacterized flavoprotein (TIGR03862 family)